MKNIIFLIVGVAATLGIISATSVTNQVFATTAEEDELPDCPGGNPCKKTDVDTEPINQGLDKETTTTTKESCTAGSGSPGTDGTTCPGQGKGTTQTSEPIGEPECVVKAKNARGGEDGGQTTGRQC